MIGRYLYKVPSPKGPTGPGISSNGFTLVNLISEQKHRIKSPDCFKRDAFILKQVFVEIETIFLLRRVWVAIVRRNGIELAHWLNCISQIYAINLLMYHIDIMSHAKTKPNYSLNTVNSLGRLYLKKSYLIFIHY